MFKKYFQEELDNLKKALLQYSKDHPETGRIFGNTFSDPDIAALFEGTAFLTGEVKQKIEDEYPEIINELTCRFWPHYLKPLPSATIIAFKPTETLRKSIKIPAGIYVKSKPVNGTSCRFKTCYDVELHPLKLLDVWFEELPGKPAVIKLMLELKGITISQWKPKTLRLFMAGDYNRASELYLLLRKNLRSITLKTCKSGNKFHFSRKNLLPIGFSENQELIPYPEGSETGYRIIQEYFLMPEKFLFLDLTGWEEWNRNKGEDSSKFEIHFELKETPLQPLKINKESISLFACPAVNIFPYKAVPIIIDHKKTEYPVLPETDKPSNYQVYSIEKVSGFITGTLKEKEYKHFHDFNFLDLQGYNEIVKPYEHSNNFDVSISVGYRQGSKSLKTEILSLEILCTNSSLPESLAPGDICIPTATSPEFADFSNLSSPTPNVLVSDRKNSLWRLLSNLNLNYLSLNGPDKFKAVLRAYIPKKINAAVNEKRIAAIKDIKTKAANRFVQGFFMRGIEVKITTESDPFVPIGDIFVMGCVLDSFLSLYASQKTFTRLILEDTIKEKIYKWPARAGARLFI